MMHQNLSLFLHIIYTFMPHIRVYYCQNLLFSSGLADSRYSPSRPEGQVAHAPQEIRRCTMTSFLLPMIPSSTDRLTLIFLFRRVVVLLMFPVYVASIVWMSCSTATCKDLCHWPGLLPMIPQTGCRCHLVRQPPASDRYSFNYFHAEKFSLKPPSSCSRLSPKIPQLFLLPPILSSSSDSQPFAAVMPVGRAETTGSRSQQLCVRLCRAFPNYLPEERRCCQTETEEGA